MTSAGAGPVVVDENVFIERVAKIKVGTSEARILELLGAPVARSVASKKWTYRNPPNRPDGPFHVYTFTFAQGVVTAIEESSVGCVLRE